MQLSTHFSLEALTKSLTAEAHHLDNTPSPEVIAALTLVCQNVLEPVRAHFGLPINPSSGYRSPAVNELIGGAASSQHCKGEAVDFKVPCHPNIEVCRWIEANLPGFDQLIYEFGESGWVHCSFSATRARRSVITAQRRNGKTCYLPGLVV